MRDYLSFPTAPYDCDCAQVGDDDYRKNARSEGQRLIAMLEKRFPNKPEGAEFRMKSFPHDFGTYYEVAVTFDDRDDMAMAFAFHVEENIPATWDDDAVIPFNE